MIITVNIGDEEYSLLKKYMEHNSLDETAALNEIISKALLGDKLAVGIYPTTRLLDIEDLPKKFSRLVYWQGIETVGDLVQYRRSELVQIPQLGPKTMHDAVVALEKYGIFLEV